MTQKRRSTIRLLLRWGVRALAVPLILVSRKPPLAMLSWLWCVSLFPYLGSAAYLLFGVDRLERKRLKRLRRWRDKRALGGARPFKVTGMQDAGSRERSLLRLLANVNDLPTTTASELRLLIDARSFYPALLEEIRAARHHIHVMFFLWRDDAWGRTFRDELVAAARRGVVVRLLLDEIGCVWLSSRFFDTFVEAGGRFSWCHTLHPWRNRFFVNLRNHRKIQVFDGKTAFIGGMNIGREYAGADPSVGKWRDVQLELSGEAVTQLQDLFIEDWFFATGERINGRAYYLGKHNKASHLSQLIAGGPDSHWREVEKSLVALLNFAGERVWILPSYFVPSRVLLNALQLCAARGVEVRILISKKCDHRYLYRISRAYYREMLRFGVRVFEFDRAVSHSKVMVIDGQWLLVGSANFDNRSLELNFEANLLVHAPEQARDMERVLEADFAACTEMVLGAHASKSERLVDGACKLLAPLL